MGKTYRYVRRCRDLSLDDVPLAGGKNASLGEMHREPVPKRVKVPNGFAVTAETYRDLVRCAGILPEMEALAAGRSRQDLEEFARRGRRLRALPVARARAAGNDVDRRRAYGRREPGKGAS